MDYILKALAVLALTALSGICYRLGGRGKIGGWKDKISYSGVRDIGCPVLTVLALCLLFGFNSALWYVYLIFILLSWAALTTYWDEIFGYDNFYAHGFGCGLAGLVLMFVVPWWAAVVRYIICPIGMGLWSHFVKRDVPQEIGRGVAFVL